MPVLAHLQAQALRPLVREDRPQSLKRINGMSFICFSSKAKPPLIQKNSRTKKKNNLSQLSSDYVCIHSLEVCVQQNVIAKCFQCLRKHV